MNQNRIACALIALTLTAAVAAPANADAAGKAKSVPKATGFDSKMFSQHNAFPFVCRTRASLC